MKKVIALLVALILLLALASCGSGSSAGDSTSDTTGDSTSSTTTSSSEDSSSDNSTDSEETTTENTDSTSGDASDTEGTIYIGHICDLTGVETMTGQEAKTALEFAVDRINEEDGGIAGRQVEVITMDAQGDSTTAVDAARQLVENNHVVAIFGPTQVGHKNAVGAYATSVGVPVIYYNGTPTEIVEDNDYIIATGGSTNQMPTAMADYIYNELGYRTINTITQENTGGENYMQPLIDKFEELGGTVLSSQEVPTDESDTSAYLLNLKDADCIVAWLSGSQAINLWTNWYDLGVSERMPMYGCTHGGFTDYFICESLEETSPEVVDAMLEDTIVPITYALSLDNTKNDEFAQAWKEEYGTTSENTNLPGACFTALLVFKSAVESIGGSTESEALYNALQQVDTDTPEGHVYFSNGSRIAVRDVHICKLIRTDDGTFSYELLDTYEHVPAEGL